MKTMPHLSEKQTLALPGSDRAERAMDTQVLLPKRISSCEADYAKTLEEQID